MKASAPSLTEIPHIGMLTALGAVLGALVVAVPLVVALALAGSGPSGIVAGAHVGFFGGMGFGGMIGAVLAATRSERH